MILALRDEISNDNLSFAEAKADAFLFYAPGRRATGPISAGVTPSRVASAGKAGVGPFQRNWSTLSKRAMSVRSVASLRKSRASSRSRERVSARALALATFTRHSR